MKLRKEDGYALASVLLISIIITMMLFSLFSIVLFNNNQFCRLSNKRTIELACFSAVQVILNNKNLISSDSLTLRINSIEVHLIIRNKGFSRELITSAKSGKDSVKIKYFLGIKANKNGYFNNAIILSHPNLKATVAGNTEIYGDILVATDKIGTGNIYGESPVNPNYLKGELKTLDKIKTHLISDSLFSEIFESYKSFPTKFPENIDEITSSEYESYESDVVNNFLNNIMFKGYITSNLQETKMFRIHGVTEFLQNSVLKANTIIYSDTLTIRKGSHIENTFFYCNGPISIEERCYFKDVQVFSTDSIHISSSQFDYPSIICLSINESDSTKLKKALNIEKSVINGAVILMTRTSGLSSNKNKISIDKESEIQGLVYSENNLELLGKVTGTVFTYNFFYYKSPTVYINWLVNMKVNRKELDSYFLLPAVFKEEGNYQILSQEWIY